MSRAIYLTHPQVRINSAVPVPDWGLSDVGRARAQAASAARFLRDLSRIVASRERKANETADIFAAARGLTVIIRDGLHENDRSATGYLEPAEFERTADAFFARPHESVRGWEKAADAQARIVAGFEAILRESGAPGSILLCGHGGVGTLLYCHLAGFAISRAHDQPAGGGNYFTFDISARRVLHGWRPIERFDDA